MARSIEVNGTLRITGVSPSDGGDAEVGGGRLTITTNKTLHGRAFLLQGNSPGASCSYCRLVLRNVMFRGQRSMAVVTRL